MAVYDISPMLPGHSLIIPKEHMESIYDLTPEKMVAFFEFARKVTKGLCSFLETDAFDWSLQEKEEAGQSVPHLHLHIIPRTKNDLAKTGDWFPVLMKNNKQAIIDSKDRPRFNEDEFQKITEKLKERFALLKEE